MGEPTKVTQLYAAAGVGPHGVTTRWTYTVPAGRLAMIETLNAHVLRDAASGAPAIAGGYVQYTPAAGAATRVINPTIINGALGAVLDAPAIAPFFAQPGDVFLCQTLDLSAGGTLAYVFTLIATEMDA